MIWQLDEDKNQPLPFTVFGDRPVNVVARSSEENCYVASAAQRQSSNWSSRVIF